MVAGCALRSQRLGERNACIKPEQHQTTSNIKPGARMDIQFVAFRDASEDAGRASWPLPPLQMKHDAPIRESQLIHSCKEFAEGLTERGFGNVCIDGVAAAQQLLKLGVTWRYPFEDEVLCRQAAAQGGDAIH